MSQSPITVTYSLEEILKQINQKLDNLDTKIDSKIDNLDAKFTAKIDKLGEKVEHLTVEVATVKTKIESLENDVKDLKNTQKNQIWSLIALSFTAVIGLSGASATVVIKLFSSSFNT